MGRSIAKVIIMWKNILLKDFKFKPDEPKTLGRHSMATGPFINLSSEQLKDKSEEEMIDMIVTTLSHESAHQAFGQVADKFGESIYKMAVYFNELYMEVMKTGNVNALDEEKLQTLVGETVGSAVVDELFAHEAGNFGGKGPEQLYFSGYHIDVADEVRGAFDGILDIMDENKEHFKQLLDPKNYVSPTMKEAYNQMIKLHDLLMKLFKKLMDKLANDVEHKYKLVLITLINKKAVSGTLDFNNPMVKNLLNAIMAGKFELLDRELTRRRKEEGL